ncbi:MAG: hypothetical protein M1834_003592 [Cirrosporium novae-zelandiae]|nr:MAG: hypothetical protein M1834_003592 [Cirrosporium novae-zelandiae]
MAEDNTITKQFSYMPSPGILFSSADPTTNNNAITEYTNQNQTLTRSPSKGHPTTTTTIIQTHEPTTPLNDANANLTNPSPNPTPTTTVDYFPLLSLPPELRTKIYTFYFHLPPIPSIFPSRLTTHPHPPLPLLLTNHQINHEASHLPFTTFHFTFTPIFSSSVHHARSFLHSLLPWQVSCIRAVTVRVVVMRDFLGRGHLWGWVDFCGVLGKGGGLRELVLELEFYDNEALSFDDGEDEDEDESPAPESPGSATTDENLPPSWLFLDSAWIVQGLLRLKSLTKLTIQHRNPKTLKRIREGLGPGIEAKMREHGNQCEGVEVKVENSLLGREGGEGIGIGIRIRD